MIAVSGGRDSVVLLHWLWQQALSTEWVVCHFNHGLRGRESGHDAAFVRRLARFYGMTCEVKRVDVWKMARSARLSIETAAREARHAFFLEVGQRHGTLEVFLAHHAEDQAETLLANCCRGAGLAGLGGMKRRQVMDNGLILNRPLLTWSRQKLDDYLLHHGLKYREDSSNASLKPRRNRVRREVLPLLDSVFERRVAGNLERLAGICQRDEAFFQQLVTDWVAQHGVFKADGSLFLSEPFLALHPAVQSRVLQRWLLLQGAVGLSHDHLEAAMRLTQRENPPRHCLPGNRLLRRKARHLHLEPT
jgi:tRNA(Ile)-lysidine synthase